MPMKTTVNGVAVDLPDIRDRAAVLTYVAGQLIKQGTRSMRVDAQCAYRGDAPDGDENDSKPYCCGLGWLIPDDRYSPALEGVTLSVEHMTSSSRQALIEAISWGTELDDEDLGFLDLIQHVHDSGRGCDLDPETWAEYLHAAFRDLARDYDVEYVPPDTETTPDER
jgi:hypothetical protein